VLVGIFTVATACGLLIAGIALAPKRAIDRYLRGVNNDTTVLRDRSAEFASALRSERYDRAYRLFNAAFRAEIPEADFGRAVRGWLRGRRVSRVLTTHVQVQGLSGLISSNLYFYSNVQDTSREDQPDARRNAEDFLFQYWLRTGAGWELMWLNKALDPVAMDYGRKSEGVLQEILPLALEEIVTRRGLEGQTGMTSLSNYVILLSRTGHERRPSLPNKSVLWLSEDSIRSLSRRRPLDYYIDIQPLRVINDVAVGTFDIVPLSRAVASPRRRSIKLFFVKRGDNWEFANYGSNW
jgi:hypothetical protein